MKQGTTVVDGKTQTVKIFRMKEWSGLQGDDKIYSIDPDEKIFIRDGELHIFSDREHETPSKEFIPA